MSVVKANKYEVTYEGYYDCVKEIVEAEGVTFYSENLTLHKNNETVFAISMKRLIRLKRIEESKDENRQLKKSA